MLALNRLLLSREYALINALKALASILCMCNLRVIFLSNITPRYFHYLQFGCSDHSVEEKTQAVLFDERNISRLYIPALAPLRH
jgi:hypothetical protein